MKIIVEQLGKRFNQEWIFKDFSYSFQLNQSYAIIGVNGSGKSTLLQVIAGIQPPSAGKLVYQATNQKNIEADQIFRYLSLAAPYLELIEEFTLWEHINFHRRFKKLPTTLSNEALITLLRLEKARNKFIKNFSSGMKQRLKLGLAFYSTAPVLLLDEPTSNLDSENMAWYKKEVLQNRKDRLIIVSSNQPEEYDFCEHTIHLK
ncbi:MAG: ATP-binding cassette domain-containing protein [Thermonemataceae bacterium]